MSELTAIIDPVTGDLVVEGKLPEAYDLLGTALEVNCAVPLATQRVPLTPGPPKLRVASIWHGDVTAGPGRRSVVQLQGCSIRCPGCYVPETHDPRLGTPMSIYAVVNAILGPAGEPRDGVTIIGGEPFDQPEGLVKLLLGLHTYREHVTCYTGHTLGWLRRQRDPHITVALCLIDLLIDGPFIQALSQDPGEWIGSANQRIIPNPGDRPWR